MAKPQRQKTVISPLKIAEDLHKHHTHAEAAFLANPQQIIYTEEVVIKILTKYGLPEPDFEGYAKLSKTAHNSKRKELLHLSSLIKAGMEAKGLNNTEFAKLARLTKGEVTRILSGANMTAATMMRIEYVLDIKLLNH